MPTDGRIDATDYVGDMTLLLGELQKTLAANGVVPTNTLQDALQQFARDVAGMAAQLTFARGQAAQAQQALTQCQSDLQAAKASMTNGSAAPPPGGVPANGQPIKPGTYVTAQAAGAIALGALVLGAIGGGVVGNHYGQKKSGRLNEARENPLLGEGTGLQWRQAGGYLVAKGQRCEYAIWPEDGQFSLDVIRPRQTGVTIARGPNQAALKQRAEQYERTGR
jgi:hypothetical protein